MQGGIIDKASVAHQQPELRLRAACLACCPPVEDARVGGHVVWVPRNTASVKGHHLRRLRACHSCFNSSCHGMWGPHLVEAILAGMHGREQRVGDGTRLRVRDMCCVRLTATQQRRAATHLQVRGVEAPDPRVRHAKRGTGDGQLSASGWPATVCVACACL